MAATDNPLNAVHPLSAVEEHKAVLVPSDQFTDDIALKRVKADYDSAETFRRRNHDWRFANADARFLGWKPQKYWEGTKIPRSSLSTYLTMEQVESMLPKVISMLFGESYWFDARPYPSTHMDEARAVQELILAQLREVNGSTGIREVSRLCGKSGLQYGNGYIYLGWKRHKEQVPFYRDELIPITVPFPDPVTGQMIQMPTGKYNRQVAEEIKEVEVNEPELQYRSIRDCFIDPHCSSPNPRKARYFIERLMVTIRELETLRDTPGMNIPKSDVLLAMAQEKMYSAADTSRQTQEAHRGTSYQPHGEYVSGGEEQTVELLRYWTANRLVWVLNRKHVAYNIPNPYNKIPFYGCWYVDVIDRHYALSMSDVLESEQLLQENVINAQMDELSLYFNKPIKKKRGQPIPLSQLRRRPGLVTEADDPEKDVIAEDNKPLLQDSYAQIQISEIRAQRRTGLSELVAFGSGGSGNSANRTATGIQTQVSASLSRIGYFIENFQENVIVPLLDDLLLYNQKFNTTEGVVQFLGAEGQIIKLDSTTLRRAELKFEMRASNKANSRAAMQQQIGLIAQTFLNPVLLEMLQMEGKTVDAQEIFNMVLDATGARPHKSAIIRNLTPQEMQMRQQGSIDQTKIMTQQIRGQSQMDITQEKEASAIVQKVMELQAKQKQDKEKKDSGNN